MAELGVLNCSEGFNPIPTVLRRIEELSWNQLVINFYEH
jgi:hypothetical protein